MALNLRTLGDDLYQGRRSINFVGDWKRWIAIGTITMAICVGILLVRGLTPGIEFRGGSQFQINGISDVSQQTAVDVVTAEVGGEAPRVSNVGQNAIRVQTGRLTDEQTTALRDKLATAYNVEPGDVTSSFVGATWGKDVTSKALMGLVIFLLVASVFISFYFRAWQMAVAAILALVHDLVATVGIYSLAGFEVTPASVIGFLTILGYSLYDTVVVFDKVRENTAHIQSSTKQTYGEAVNLAVNQTLVRSVNTSIVGVLPVFAIFVIGAYLLGAGTLKDISLALMVGMIAGTYSSVFLAAPVLVLLRSREPAIKAQAERVAKARAKAAEPVPAAAAAAAAPADPRQSRPRGPRNQPKRKGRHRH